MAVNKYGNNKPVVKEKKVKTEVLLEIGTELDNVARVEDKELLGQVKRFGKTYNRYSKDK